jgi:hypothetical protein
MATADLMDFVEVLALRQKLEDVHVLNLNHF